MADLRVSGLTVDDLLVREEITDVVKALARGTDRLDRELMASCYHADGTDDHNVFRGTGAEFAQWEVRGFQAATGSRTDSPDAARAAIARLRTR